MFPGIARRTARAALLVSVFALAACSDDPVRITDDAHGDEVERLRLYVTPPGIAEYSYLMSQSATAHEVEITAGVNAIRVEWLDEHGDMVTGLEEDFRLNFGNLPTGIVFTPTGPFAGTLTVEETIGISAATLELFHIEEGHPDFSVAVEFFFLL